MKSFVAVGVFCMAAMGLGACNRQDTGPSSSYNPKYDGTTPSTLEQPTNTAILNAPKKVAAPAAPVEAAPAATMPGVEATTMPAGNP